MVPARQDQPHLQQRVRASLIKLFTVLVFLISMAGCVGNAEYREFRDRKHRYPEFEFETRAPYQTADLAPSGSPSRRIGCSRVPI